MTECHNHYANARNLAVDILRKETKRTPDMIREVAIKAAQAVTIFEPSVSIDVDALTAELRHLFSVGVEDATVLDDYDPKGHVPWLPNKRANVAPGFWRFWTRYMTYLERDFGMPPAVVSNLDELTNMVLERLEDPSREPPWDRRGMVVGSVQSGKTANYTGLICKALDAGYKLVIVLAGMHDNLRSQTQIRIDEGVVGFDTKKVGKLNQVGRAVGVGRLPGDRLVVHPLTSRLEKGGDFTAQAAQNVGVMLRGDPVVLVVKKYSSVLENIFTWVKNVAGETSGSSEKAIIKDVPLLIIDDEADNASINTGKTDSEVPSKINGKIRQLLDAFEKSAYVGYTATPFANIFINPETETPEFGEDLFPRSFIINVKAPSNHIGPSRVFGLEGDPDAGIEASNGLPIVREIQDFSQAFPPKHKKDHIPTQLPESLKKAIRCFILTCAARRARNQDKKHNSMLVHVTRFVNVQDHVVELIRVELGGLQRRIELGDGSRRPTITDELETLWNAEYVPVTQALGKEAGPLVSWTEVQSQLHAAAAKITVLPINGSAKEALDYKDHEVEGRNVIAVGGDKLSRGLTLEGLSISYFLRTTRMYDTLMQMGRWFGYRPGYLDLCRLFTTRTLKDWYRHIALAEAELRREFDYMVAAGLTPENYGLRVRTHPDGMIVTALNKMSWGQTRELKWPGVLSQTTDLPKELCKLAANYRTTENLLSKLSAPSVGSNRETRVWRDVSAQDVAVYIETLQFPPASARASGEQLASFIRKQAGKSPAELTSWTVALVSNTQASENKQRKMAGLDIGMIERSPESQNETTFSLKKANILNPTDEALDFSSRVFDKTWFDSIVNKRELANDLEWLRMQIGKAASEVALELTREWQKGDSPKLRKTAKDKTSRANGRVVRILRPVTNGLLLIYPVVRPETVSLSDEVNRSEPTGLCAKDDPVIGVALSFPTSDTTLGVEYRVTKLWAAEMLEDADYDED